MTMTQYNSNFSDPDGGCPQEQLLVRPQKQLRFENQHNGSVAALDLIL
jgi:hypothetical protein